MRYLPPYRRPHVARLTTLLKEDGPRRLVAVTGPRQTGKTTLVLQALSDLEKDGVGAVDGGHAPHSALKATGALWRRGARLSIINELTVGSAPWMRADM